MKKEEYVVYQKTEMINTTTLKENSVHVYVNKLQAVHNQI